MDDMDDAHSVYSIGIVENPIFADDAKPKGKELEVSECVIGGGCL